MSVVKYVWDMQNVLAETDGANAQQALYTQAPQVYGRLVSQRRGSTSHFALGDALGSVIGLTTSAGAISDTYRYRAYGLALIAVGSTLNPHRWLGVWGYQFDAALGKYYMRERHYNVATASWQSTDPLHYHGSQWNMYQYVYLNPVTAVDPSGTTSVICHCCIRAPRGGCNSNYYHIEADTGNDKLCASTCGPACAASRPGGTYAGDCNPKGALPSSADADPCAGGWDKMSFANCFACCLKTNEAGAILEAQVGGWLEAGQDIERSVAMGMCSAREFKDSAFGLKKGLRIDIGTWTTEGRYIKPVARTQSLLRGVLPRGGMAQKCASALNKAAAALVIAEGTVDWYAVYRCNKTCRNACTD
jgi:RHS repeat-associated protein